LDLTVSPDLDAFYCYAVVLVLGLITAYSQVSKRLTNLPGKWITVNTWLLFFAYALLPVTLFWVLDRTSAIHDTSLFAAILIGVGYQQILSGELASIRPAGDISTFWQPFAAWSDHVADGIRNRILRNEAHFDERLLSEVRQDQKKHDSLRELAFTHAKDVSVLKKDIEDIEGQRNMLGDQGVFIRTVEALYNSLKVSVPDTWQFLLYERGITSRHTYLWYGEEWRNKAAAGLVAIALVGLTVVGVISLWNPENRGRYYVWRIEKSNNTDQDRFRAGRRLMACLQETQKPYQPLTELLRFQGVPVKTAENILGLLVESRNGASNLQPSLPVLLADSLRTDNPDIRARINDVLLYLAGERNVDVGTLKEWKPSAKDSLNDIDARIKQWKQLNWAS
jgi:hypothetical protein